MEIISFENSNYYIWGNKCEGWKFIDLPNLSVIYEKMPCGTSETKHRHSISMQFFFILKGQAEIVTNERSFVLSPQQGLEIPPGTPHQIFNRGTSLLEFILVSQPTTVGDRENLET